MARQADQRPTSDSPDIRDFVQEWSNAREHYGSLVVVQTEQRYPYRVSARISVQVLPNLMRKELSGCSRDDDCEWEVWQYLIDESLNEETSDRLEGFLSTIINAQECGARRALAYLVQVYLLAIDLVRAINRKESILLGHVYTCPCARGHRRDIGSPPQFRLAHVLDFWSAYSRLFLTVVPMTSQNGHCKKVQEAVSKEHKSCESAYPLYEPIVLQLLEYYYQHHREMFRWSLPLADPAIETGLSNATCESVFRKEAQFWVLTYQGRTIRLKDARGLQYIARLLASPGQCFHVSQVVQLENTHQPYDSVPRVNPEADGLTEHSLRSYGLGDAGEILDPRAKAEYRGRLRDLSKELEEARKNHDLAQIPRLQEEYDSIEEQLRAALTPLGQPRKAADSLERMRKAVAICIKRSLDSIKEHHSELGQHLSRSLRTGTLCSYSPESACDWRLEL